SRVAAGLSGFGVGRGDVVAIHMDPSIELVLTGIGASELGARFAPMSTDYHGEFLSRNISASTARGLVAGARLARRSADAAVARPAGAADAGRARHLLGGGAPALGRRRGPKRPALTGPAGAELLAAEPIPAPSVARHDDVLMMWWSSGTTGAPKGIMQTHAG